MTDVSLKLKEIKRLLYWAACAQIGGVDWRHGDARLYGHLQRVRRDLEAARKMRKEQKHATHD